jgi:hypothetical protein
MKRCTFLLALLFLPAAARSDTVDMGAAGSFSITPPKDWTVTIQKEEDSGVAVTLAPPASVNASLIVNLTLVPKDQPVTKEIVQDAVLSLADKFVDESVEKKKTLREFTVSEGYGYYCVFTDASLVGQPPKKDVFKVVGVGAIHMTDELMATVGISCDDEKGPDFAAILASVATARFAPRK